MKNINTIKIEQLERAASMFKAIAHPMRVAILSLLEDGTPRTVTEIHNKLNMEQSTTSHHLGILKGKGILFSKRDGKNTYYYLKNESLSKLMDCINRCSS